MPLVNTSTVEGFTIKSTYCMTACGSLALAFTEAVRASGGLKSGPNCPYWDFGKAMGTITASGVLFFRVSKFLLTTLVYAR
ncbi:hypothetical protein D3C75_954050 [compost metagenome]